MLKNLRIAIVHDWLEVHGGAENVLAEMLLTFPQADVFSLVDFLPAEKRGFLQGKTPKTSFIQNLPFARNHFRLYLPLFPFAVEQFSLADYDLVISSSYAVAKGALAAPEQFHYSYCYSPIRYAWDLQSTYLEGRGLNRGLLSWPLKYALHRIRQWDRASSMGVDKFVAISHFVRKRIARCYSRDADVIYPLVDTDAFMPSSEPKGSFYLTASRLVPYKRIPLIVAAFRGMPDRELVVIGDGTERGAVEAAARNAPNIRYIGRQPQDSLVSHMQRAKAFVFAAEEDFGIVMLEANACGTPVIALGRGAAPELIRDLDQENPTGILFDAPTPQSISAAVERFEENSARFLPEHCRAHALKFSRERFRRQLSDDVLQSYRAWQEGCGSGNNSDPLTP